MVKLLEQYKKTSGSIEGAFPKKYALVKPEQDLNA
jgi:hypothetical protein